MCPSTSLCQPLGNNLVSKLKQQSNGHPKRKEGVLSELPCPRQLELSNHTREPSPHVLQVPLIFGKLTLIYLHVYVCFMVECETVCSQSCVSGWRFSVLPMGGYDGVDATYSCSSFTSYSCSSCSCSGYAKRHDCWSPRTDRAACVCVHSYCSVCRTNKVDGSVSLCSCIWWCCRSINLNTEIVHIFHVIKMQEFH
jgi:hypothetical protein